MKNWKFWLSLSIIPLFGFWIFPTLKVVESHKKEVSKLETIKSEKIKILKSLEAKKEELPTEEEQTLLKKIPLTLEQENLIRDIYKISKKTGFAFSSLGFGKGKNPDVDAPQMNIDFSVEGRLSYLKEFLTQIEQNERFLGMNNFNVGIKEKNGVKIVSLSVSLFAFAQK